MGPVLCIPLVNRDGHAAKYGSNLPAPTRHHFGRFPAYPDSLSLRLQACPAT